MDPNQHFSTPQGNGKQNLVLKALLREKGLKQSDLALQLSVDRAYVNRIIRGKEKPGPDMMIRIAKALGTDSRTIFP